MQIYLLLKNNNQEIAQWEFFDSSCCVYPGGVVKSAVFHGCVSIRTQTRPLGNPSYQTPPAWIFQSDIYKYWVLNSGRRLFAIDNLGWQHLRGAILTEASTAAVAEVIFVKDEQH